jgi:DNA-binding transcriptional LysR family regulator
MVSTAKYFVPQLLALSPGAPGRRGAAARAGNREQLVAMMQAGEVDLSVMGRPPKEVATRAEPSPRTRWSSSARRATRCWPGPRAGFGAGALPLHRPRTRLGHAQCACSSSLPTALRARITMEISSNETIKQAVIAGMGLAFLSLHTMGLELRSGLLACWRSKARR